jgi:hypothetical protein
VHDYTEGEIALVALIGGALVVEGEETGEDLLVGEGGGPAVGGEDGFVEGAPSPPVTVETALSFRPDFCCQSRIPKLS